MILQPPPTTPPFPQCGGALHTCVGHAGLQASHLRHCQDHPQQADH